MAIYKPSNCEPFLERLDLTEDYTGSFVINTNNVAVNGYKLRILDGGNNIVFEGAKFQKINEAGVAYNGDRVTIPIIKNIPKFSFASEFNVIYYYNGGYYYYNGNIHQIVNFKNGYAVQPYKWQVILAQGLLELDDKGNLVQQPIEDKYYDMTISSGTVLGSTPNRIQGKLSEEIYKDYFIQLCDSNGNDVSNRVLIDSYDHTYGYIYPQKGEFTQDNINNSMYFKIYKNTNNIKYINTNRIVDYKTGLGITMKSITFGDDSVSNSATWGVSSDGTFFYQKYNEVVRVTGTTEKKVNVKIPVSSYTGTTIASSFVPGKTTLLVTEETDAGEATRLSKYNGVFLFVSAVWEESETDVDKGTVTVTWMRPAMADTWAEFLGQSFYVVANGSNWDSNATSSGVINSTPLSFKEEEPIVIYPNDDGDKTHGVIYKTNEDVEGSGGKKRRVYIRPFVGIKSGMRFQYLKNGETGYMDNITIDTERWCIKYASTKGPSTEFTPDIDTYSIVSFFKYSDENPFYGYGKPTISIKKINDVDFTSNDLTISARSIHVVGECSQTWKSFQWKLLDYNYNIVQYGEVTYDGEISADFIGLENEHYYEITLIIEDEFGDVFSVSGDFQVGNIDFKNPFREDLQKKLNCELHSVDAALASFGVIEPGVSDVEPINQYYKDVKFGSEDLPIIGELSEPINNGDITLNFETTITDPNFEGDIIGLEIGEELQATSEINKSGTNDVISFVIPPLTVEKNGKKVVNDKRYQVQLYRKIQGALISSIRNGSAEPITIIKDEKEEENWSEKKACYAYNDTGRKKNDIEDCDYIDFEAWPGGELNLKFDINGKKYNFKTPLDQWSQTLDQWSQIEAATRQENEIPGVWYDKKTILKQQPDGSWILVEKDEDNLLPTDENAVWSDYGYKPYELKEVKNATGREALTDYTINVNMAYKNYVYKATTDTECTVRCEFIKNEVNK